ncbi:hypothetical protein NL676_009401 [Syzygium grande]|nr:hypothetical protein NL676_009401 [Syzygium grande]
MQATATGNHLYLANPKNSCEEIISPFNMEVDDCGFFKWINPYLTMQEKEVIRQLMNDNGTLKERLQNVENQLNNGLYNDIMRMQSKEKKC